MNQSLCVLAMDMQVMVIGGLALVLVVQIVVRQMGRNRKGSSGTGKPGA